MILASVVVGSRGNAELKWNLDSAWPKGMPADAQQISAVAIDSTGVVHVSVRVGLDEPILMFDSDNGGELLGSWGAEHIFFDNSSNSWGGHGLAFQAPSNGMNRAPRLWVADILEHTAKVFDDSKTGVHSLIATMGTAGEAGSDVDVLQFGSLADVTTGKPNGKMDGQVWVSDGDGGINNRVVRLNATSDATLAVHPDWVVGGTSDDTEDFDSPHSIAYHEPSASVIVADRNNFRLLVLDAATGTKMAEWTDCLGSPSPTANGTVAPWGVRFWYSEEATLAVVAVCDSPEDGGNQRIVVLDVSEPDSLLHKGLRSNFNPNVEEQRQRRQRQNQRKEDIGSEVFDEASMKCGVLAEIPVDPATCLTPHELAVDQTSGDIYLACVTMDPGPSNVLRFRFTGGK